MQSLLL